MIDERDALQKIFAEYDEDRTRARVLRDMRVKEVTEKYPELLAFEKRITELGMENFKKILENPAESEKLNEKFQKELNAIKKEREIFLQDKGIEKDFDEVKYKCGKCLDTGYINNEKCPCLIQKIIDLHYEMSNMKGILHDFSEFSFDFYKDKYSEKVGMTEKENIKEIFEKAKNFCEKDECENLLFYGGCGVGKTFLSSCIAKKMLDSGKSVIYQTAASLFSDYEDYKFGRKEDGEIFDILQEADLLIIDDLGAEVSNSLSSQFFLDLINKRNMLGKKMIISTNLTMDGIRNKYTERLLSRIFENFEVLQFVGEDIRIQKLS